MTEQQRKARWEEAVEGTCRELLEDLKDPKGWTASHVLDVEMWPWPEPGTETDYGINYWVMPKPDIVVGGREDAERICNAKDGDIVRVEAPEDKAVGF